MTSLTSGISLCTVRRRGLFLLYTQLPVYLSYPMFLFIYLFFKVDQNQKNELMLCDYLHKTTAYGSEIKSICAILGLCLIVNKMCFLEKYSTTAAGRIAYSCSCLCLSFTQDWSE